MMQAIDRLINTLHSSAIIHLTINSASHNTDANIDASYHRTHHGSNRVVSVDKILFTSYKKLVNND